jgi:hypothetical protein
MLAMIVVTASVVAWLSAVWISNQVWPVSAPAVGVEIIEIAVDSEEGMSGDDPELGEGQEITPSELPAREEELAFDEPEVAQVMSSVLEAIAEHEADFADPSRAEGTKASGRPGAPGGSGKEGTGDGSSAIPRDQRWQIIFPRGQTLSGYARMLDFLKIELGIVRDNAVRVVSGVSLQRPIIVQGGVDENRLYFVWTDNQRQEQDRRLLAKLGIPADGAIIAQFYPLELEEKLAQMERAFANREVEKIRQTVFSVRPVGEGYEFFVSNQTATDDSE